LLSPVPTYVDSGRGIVRMVVLSGIEVGNCLGGVVGDVPVKHVSEHLPGVIVVEFFDLFPNVAKESIAGPSAMMTGQPPRNIAIAAPERME
jgi:hypothetical protein